MPKQNATSKTRQDSSNDVPWADILAATPDLVKAVGGLLKKEEKPPIPASSDTREQIAAVRTRVERAEALQREQDRVLKLCADQVSGISAQVDRLTERAHIHYWMTGVCAVSAVLAMLYVVLKP